MRKLTTPTLPIYRQLAGELRYQIGTGTVQPGEPLPSYRDGAKRWGVNLHTVRRAYQELEAEGLVSISAGRRAAVTLSPAAHADRSLDHFLRRVLAEAARFHDLDAISLARHLERLAQAGAPVVHVAECSLSLARNIADELETALRVKCVPMLTTDLSGVPAGAVLVSTHFHRKELRAVTRRADLELVPLVPHPRFLASLTAGVRRSSAIVLLETDPVFAANVRANLEEALGREVRVVITNQPIRSLRRLGTNDVVIVSPRNWDHMPAHERARATAHQLMYAVPRDSLVRLAMTRGYELAVNDCQACSCMDLPESV